MEISIAVTVNLFHLLAHWQVVKIDKAQHQHLDKAHNPLLINYPPPHSHSTPAEHSWYINVPWHAGWKPLSYRWWLLKNLTQQHLWSASHGHPGYMMCIDADVHPIIPMPPDVQNLMQMCIPIERHIPPFKQNSDTPHWTRWMFIWPMTFLGLVLNI